MKRLLPLIPVILALMVVSLRWINPGAVDFKFWKCDEYCEGRNECGETLTHIPAQPLNTYSNLFYLLAGLAALRRRRKLASVTFAIACGILFVGSSWFHALISEPGSSRTLSGCSAFLPF